MLTPLSMFNIPIAIMLFRTPDSPGRSGRKAASAAAGFGEDIRSDIDSVHHGVFGIGGLALASSRLVARERIQELVEPGRVT